MTSTPQAPPDPASDFARVLGIFGEPATPPTPEAAALAPSPDPFFPPAPESEPERPHESEPEPERLPTGDELLAIIKAIDWMVMRGVAGTKYPSIPAEILGPAIKLQPEDEAALAELAPYAAEYLPEVAKYIKPVMACAFVGVWGMAVVSRAKNLGVIHEELRVKRARVVNMKEEGVNGRAA